MLQESANESHLLLVANVITSEKFVELIKKFSFLCILVFICIYVHIPCATSSNQSVVAWSI